mgnify:CR=1 FL=1
MKILLTGAAGFVGLHTAQALLARGDEVLGCDNLNDYYDPALKAARLAEQTAGGWANLDKTYELTATALGNDTAQVRVHPFGRAIESVTNPERCAVKRVEACRTQRIKISLAGGGEQCRLRLEQRLRTRPHALRWKIALR